MTKEEMRNEMEMRKPKLSRYRFRKLIDRLDEANLDNEDLLWLLNYAEYMNYDFRSKEALSLLNKTGNIELSGEVNDKFFYLTCDPVLRDKLNSPGNLNDQVKSYERYKRDESWRRTGDIACGVIEFIGFIVLFAFVLLMAAAFILGCNVPSGLAIFPFGVGNRSVDEYEKNRGKTREMKELRRVALKNDRNAVNGLWRRHKYMTREDAESILRYTQDGRSARRDVELVNNANVENNPDNNGQSAQPPLETNEIAAQIQ